MKIISWLDDNVLWPIVLMKKRRRMLAKLHQYSDSGLSNLIKEHGDYGYCIECYESAPCKVWIAAKKRLNK
jgi:hypothetical protein